MSRHRMKNEANRLLLYLLLSIQPLFCFLIVPDLLFDPLRAVEKVYVNLFFTAATSLFAAFFLSNVISKDQSITYQLVLVFYLTALPWLLLQAADFHVVVDRAAWGSVYFLLVVVQIFGVAVQL